MATATRNGPVRGYEGLDRIYRKSRRRMHHALLVTAGGEDYSGEANAGNLSAHASCVHRRPRAVVDLRPLFDELASDPRQCGDTRVFRRYLNPESALQRIAVGRGAR
jgi:hypothetical protein